MKKVIIYGNVLKKICLSAGGILCLVAACKMQLPSEIRLKASPSFKAVLGERTFTLTDQLHQTLTDAASGGQYYIYQYNKHDGKLNYLIHYPLQSVELDVKKYFEGISKTESFSKQFPRHTFKIPKFESSNFKVDCNDINTKMLDQFKCEETLPFPPALSGTVKLPIDITFGRFNTVTFESGAKIVMETENNGFNYTISDAVLKTGAGEITGTVSGGKTIEFPVDSNTPIKKNVRLNLTVTAAAGSVQNGKIKLNIRFEGTVKKADGVTLTIPIEQVLSPTTLQLPPTDDFVRAKIEEGSVGMNIETPSDWGGIEIQKKLSLKQAGRQMVAAAGFTALKVPVSLQPNELTKEGVTAEVTVKITLQNATYTRPDSLPVTVDFNLKKLAEVTFKYPDSLKEKRIEEPLSEAVTKYISKIEFEEIAAEVVINHNLPTGNDITVSLSSDAFAMRETSKTFPPNDASPKDFSGAENYAWDITPGSKIDLTAKVSLPNTKENDVDAGGGKTFTLKNIELNKADTVFTFDGNLTLTPKWNKVTVKKIEGSAQQGSVEILKEGHPLKKVFEKLDKYGIAFDDIPLYFYCHAPLAGSSPMKAQVKLSAKMKNSAGEEITELLVGTQSGYAAVIDLNSTALSLPVNAREYMGRIPQAAFEISEPKKDNVTIHNTLADILNAHPQTLSINYEVGTNEQEFTKEELEALTGNNTQIRTDVLIKIPAGFSVNANSEIPLLEAVNADKFMSKDVLGRKSVWDVHDKKRSYTKLIKELGLVLDIENATGIGDIELILRLAAKDKDGDAVKNAKGQPVVIEKTLPIKKGSSSVGVTFTDSDRNLIMDNLMVSEIVLKPKNAHYQLNYDAQLAVKLIVCTGIDIDIGYRL